MKTKETIPHFLEVGGGSEEKEKSMKEKKKEKSVYSNAFCPTAIRSSVRLWDELDRIHLFVGLSVCLFVVAKR